MKKKVIITILFCIAVLAIFHVYKSQTSRQMIDKLSNEPPIVFSARLENEDIGTFKYDISSDKYEKMSDFVFYELSYSEDHDRIIGAISEDEFQGIAELDMKDNTFTPIISLTDLNACAKELGLDEIKYSGPGKTDIHMPKYYKDGYTFSWESWRNNICYLTKENDTWHMEVWHRYNGRNYSYFIKEENSEEIIFLEINEAISKRKLEKGVNRAVNDSDLELVLKIPKIDFDDLDGIMEMSADKSKLVHYKGPEIYIYDLESKKKEHVINQFLFFQYILDLKFSYDEKYLFYTVADVPYMWDDIKQLHFFIVDLESKEKIELTKWKRWDIFYGIDW